MRLALPILLLSVLPLVACGGSSATLDGGSPLDASSPVDADAAATHYLTIHVRASTKPTTHLDGWSGQTPRAQSMGVRALTLGKGPLDPAPWTVFDLAAGFVEAPLNDGADTIVAKVPASTILAGNYVYARAYVSHVRYEVDAVVHALGASVPGTFRNVQVLSNGTTIDGVTRDSGWYSFSFSTGSQTFGPVTGPNGPLPQTSGPGITLTVEDGKASYGFPVALDALATNRDVDVVMEANTEADFRWEETAGAGHTDGAFDVDPPSTFEPVHQFGANSLALSLIVH